MAEFIAANEAVIRLGSFLGIFVVMALWELIAPRRQLQYPKLARWSNNIGLVVINTVVVRLLFPFATVGVALYAEGQQWGLFNRLDWPAWLEVLLAVVMLDMLIYFQHVMFHAVPAFWRLHRVHHADPDFDVTTGARFHPIEIILSMLIKFAAILLLGPALLAVVIFEVLLNATSMFNHSNVKLPLALDGIIRLLIVTPDMHRVHHSHHPHETNSNFGFNISLWDRLFGTYRAQPQDGHERMVIGIDTWRDARHCIALSGLLSMPFAGRSGEYAINRREWKREDDT